MKKPYKIPINIYHCEVFFLISEDVHTDVNKLNKKYKCPQTERVDEILEGQSLDYDTKHYYVVVNKNCVNMNTVAHEIYHTTEIIAGARGVVESESRAWLCGYISEKIYNYLKKNQIELK